AAGRDPLDGLARAPAQRRPRCAVPACGTIDVDGSRAREVAPRIEDPIGEAERRDLLETSRDALAEPRPAGAVPHGDRARARVACPREPAPGVDAAPSSECERQDLAVAVPRPDAGAERLPCPAVPPRDPGGLVPARAREAAGGDHAALPVDHDRVDGGRT